MEKLENWMIFIWTAEFPRKNLRNDLNPSEIDLHSRRFSGCLTASGDFKAFQGRCLRFHVSKRTWHVGKLSKNQFLASVSWIFKRPKNVPKVLNLRSSVWLCHVIRWLIEYIFHKSISATFFTIFLVKWTIELNDNFRFVWTWLVKHYEGISSSVQQFLKS